MARRAPATRREEILDTTANVWRHRGVARVRVSDIAEELGVSVGLIPYHFGSKDGVIAAAFRRVAERDLQRVTSVDEPEPARRLGCILEMYMAEDPTWPLWLNAYGEALYMPALLETVRESSRAWQAAFAEELDAGMRCGAWYLDDPADTAARLLAALDGFGIHASLRIGLASHDRTGRWARRLVAAELGIEAAALDQQDPQRDPPP